MWDKSFFSWPNSSILIIFCYYSWMTVIVVWYLMAWRPCLVLITQPQPMLSWKLSTIESLYSSSLWGWSKLCFRPERKDSRRKKVGLYSVIVPFPNDHETPFQIYGGREGSLYLHVNIRHNNNNNNIYSNYLQYKNKRLKTSKITHRNVQDNMMQATQDEWMG